MISSIAAFSSSSYSISSVYEDEECFLFSTVLLVLADEEEEVEVDSEEDDGGGAGAGVDATGFEQIRL